jgi:hypothetical protein
MTTNHPTQHWQPSSASDLENNNNDYIRDLFFEKHI